MGAFNSISAVTACPFCDHVQEWTIQFKYGDCWQYSYRVGDIITWGGNDYGENVGGQVRTDGIAEEQCKKCQADAVEAAIYFIDNKIIKIELLRKSLNLQNYYEKL